MTRRIAHMFLIFGLAVTLSFGTLMGCRTIMGLLSGDLDLEDIDKDIRGMKALAHAMSKANQAITPEDEYYLGRAVAVNVLNQHRYQYVEAGQVQAGQLSAGLTNYLFHIGKILVAASERKPLKGDRPVPLAGYHFIVLNSPEINAFAAPGGYIFITTGILRLARNEDEVAGILAHEMCHVLRGHGINAIKKARWNSVKKIFFSEAASGVFGDSAAATDFLNAAVSDILKPQAHDHGGLQPESRVRSRRLRYASVGRGRLQLLVPVQRHQGHGPAGRRTQAGLLQDAPLAHGAHEIPVQGHTQVEVPCPPTRALRPLPRGHGQPSRAWYRQAPQEARNAQYLGFPGHSFPGITDKSIDLSWSSAMGLRSTPMAP